MREQAKKEDNLNLPFTFPGKKKKLGRTWEVQCEECGTVLTRTIHTYIIVCPHCQHFNKYEKEEDGKVDG